MCASVCVCVYVCASIITPCCSVYDSLKEFCPQRSLLGPAACWIVKPNCSSRGVGVRLTDDMVELAAGRSEGRVVQKCGSSWRCSRLNP